MDQHDDSAASGGDKGQVGSLLAKAAAALEEVRSVVVRSSQIGKIKLDSTFLRRDRDQLLRELGAGVYALVRAKALDLPDSFDSTISRIAELDRELAEQEKELAVVEGEGAQTAAGSERGAPPKDQPPS